MADLIQANKKEEIIQKKEAPLIEEVQKTGPLLKEDELREQLKEQKKPEEALYDITKAAKKRVETTEKIESSFGVAEAEDIKETKKSAPKAPKYIGLDKRYTKEQEGDPGFFLHLRKAVEMYENLPPRQKAADEGARLLNTIIKYGEGYTSWKCALRNLWGKDYRRRIPETKALVEKAKEERERVAKRISFDENDTYYFNLIKDKETGARDVKLRTINSGGYANYITTTSGFLSTPENIAIQISAGLGVTIGNLVKLPFLAGLLPFWAIGKGISKLSGKKETLNSSKYKRFHFHMPWLRGTRHYAVRTHELITAWRKFKWRDLFSKRKAPKASQEGWDRARKEYIKSYAELFKEDDDYDDDDSYEQEEPELEINRTAKAERKEERKEEKVEEKAEEKVEEKVEEKTEEKVEEKIDEKVEEKVEEEKENLEEENLNRINFIEEEEEEKEEGKTDWEKQQIFMRSLLNSDSLTPEVDEEKKLDKNDPLYDFKHRFLINYGAELRSTMQNLTRRFTERAVLERGKALSKAELARLTPKKLYPLLKKEKEGLDAYIRSLKAERGTKEERAREIEQFMEGYKDEKEVSSVYLNMRLNVFNLALQSTQEQIKKEESFAIADRQAQAQKDDVSYDGVEGIYQGNKQNCWACSGASCANYYKRKYKNDAVREADYQARSIATKANARLSPEAVDFAREDELSLTQVQQDFEGELNRLVGRVSGNLYSQSDAMINGLSNTAVRYTTFDCNRRNPFLKDPAKRRIIIDSFQATLTRELKKSGGPVAVNLAGHYVTVYKIDKNGNLEYRDSLKSKPLEVCSGTVEEFFDKTSRSGLVQKAEIVSLYHLDEKSLNEISEEYGLDKKGEELYDKDGNLTLKTNIPMKEHYSADRLFHNTGVDFAKRYQNDPLNDLELVAEEMIYLPKNRDAKKNQENIPDRVDINNITLKEKKKDGREEAPMPSLEESRKRQIEAAEKHFQEGSELYDRFRQKKEEQPKVVEKPKVEIEKPKVEVEKPKVEVEKPKVEVEKPKAEVEKPKVEEEQPKEAEKPKKIKKTEEAEQPSAVIKRVKTEVEKPKALKKTEKRINKSKLPKKQEEDAKKSGAQIKAPKKKVKKVSAQPKPLMTKKEVEQIKKVVKNGKFSEEQHRIAGKFIEDIRSRLREKFGKPSEDEIRAANFLGYYDTVDYLHVDGMPIARFVKEHYGYEYKSSADNKEGRRILRCYAAMIDARMHYPITVVRPTLNGASVFLDVMNLRHRTPTNASEKEVEKFNEKGRELVKRLKKRYLEDAVNSLQERFDRYAKTIEEKNEESDFKEIVHDNPVMKSVEAVAERPVEELNKETAKIPETAEELSDEEIGVLIEEEIGILNEEDYNDLHIDDKDDY